jgi:hypothetical protein
LDKKALEIASDEFMGDVKEHR